MLTLSEEFAERDYTYLDWWPPGTLVISYTVLAFGSYFTPLLKVIAAISVLLLFSIYLLHERRHARHPDELMRRMRQEGLAAAYPWSLFLIVAAMMGQRFLGFPPDLTNQILFLLLGFIYAIGMKAARERYL